MLKKLLLLCWLFCFVLWGCGDEDPTPSPFTPPADQAAARPATALQDCALIDDDPTTPSYVAPSTETVGQTLVCGRLTLPQDPANPAGPQHQLAYVILRARAERFSTDPIVFLAGGPGTSAILSSADWVNNPLRNTRDIILVDQRGTGYSTPSLDCDYYGIDDADEAACLAAINAAGAQLPFYHSGNNAADIAALMEALTTQEGYTRYNLYGVSYGTRLALAIMRDHPALLRSAVLDSPYPPQASAPVELAVNTANALEALFAACAADAECNAAYPTLRDSFYEMTAFLNEVPINDEYDGRHFVSDVFNALADYGRLPAVPAAIEAMFAQDFELAFNLLYGGPEGYDPQAALLELYTGIDEATLLDFFTVAEGLAESEGTFLVFECQEENFFNTYEQAEQFTNAAGIDPLVAQARLTDSAIIFDQCGEWFAQGAPAIENEAVNSDLPTLILSGALDPITPPHWATLTAETLPNSVVVQFPLATHAVYGAGECPLQIVADFFDAPEQAPNISCIQTMTLPFEIYVEE